MDKLLREFPSKIETERLIIRRYEKGDGKAVFTLFERNNNREELKEHVDEASTIETEEDAEILVRRHNAEWSSRERLVMGVWLKAENLHIGEMWIEPKKWDVPCFELGYYIDSGYQKQGFATEAAKRVTQFIFDDLKAHKAMIITHDTNERSYAVAERLGYTREGHLRECSIKEGRRYGLFYYGLLKHEYEKL